mgnify:CR=1 FL=1
MDKPELTKEIAYKKLQDFFLIKPFVLFATGTSCAVDIEFGMGALEKYLKEEIPKFLLKDNQKTEWAGVVNKLTIDSDFESAMNSIQFKITNLLVR